MLKLPNGRGHGHGHGRGDWAIGKEGRLTEDWRKCSCCTRSQVVQRAATHPPRGRSAAHV